MTLSPASTPVRRSIVLVFGDVLVDAHDFADERVRDRHVRERQPHGAGLGFRDVHQRVEHREDALGFLEAGRQRLALRRSASAGSATSARSATPRSRVIGVRRSWATLSSALPMPSMSVLMRSSIWLNERAQLVDGVAIGADRHPRVGAPRPGDAGRPRQSADESARAFAGSTRMPPASPMSTIAIDTSETMVRKRASSSSRFSVLLPTWSSVPSGSRADATSSRAARDPDGACSQQSAAARRGC